MSNDRGTIKVLPALIIRCLGPLELELDGAPLRGFQTQKALGLLVYLVCQAGQWLNREELKALFWPESSTDRSSRSLRQVLVILRRVLPPGFLLVTRQAVAFNEHSNYQLDLDVFSKQSW